MRRTYALLVLLLLTSTATTRCRAEAAGRFTYYSYVQAEALKVCAEAPDVDCYKIFDKLARIAARLDAQERRAEQLEKAGKNESAIELRRRILGDAVMLDFSLDAAILLYQRKQGSGAIPGS
jgi:hypothetical protein